MPPRRRYPQFTQRSIPRTLLTPQHRRGPGQSGGLQTATPGQRQVAQEANDGAVQQVIGGGDGGGFLMDEDTVMDYDLDLLGGGESDGFHLIGEQPSEPTPLELPEGWTREDELDDLLDELEYGGPQQSAPTTEYPAPVEKSRKEKARERKEDQRHQRKQEKRRLLDKRQFRKRQGEKSAGWTLGSAMAAPGEAWKSFTKGISGKGQTKRVTTSLGTHTRGLKKRHKRAPW